MSFAEIMLRVGVSLGGWLIFISHMLILVAIRYADCDPGSDSMWRGTLLFGVISGVAVAGVGVGLRWKDSIRWLAGIGFLLALLGMRVVVAGVRVATLGGESLCGIGHSTGGAIAGPAATGIERVWPVLQLAIVLLGMGQAILYWRVERAGPDAAPR